MKFIRGFFLTIFSIIFIAFSIGYFVLIGAQRTVLSADYYKGVVKKADISSYVINMMEERFSEMEAEFGGQMEVVSDVTLEVFDEEWIEESVNDAIDDIFVIINNPDTSDMTITINLENKKEEYSNALKVAFREYIDDNTNENISDSEITEFVNTFINSMGIFNEEEYSVDVSEYLEGSDLLSSVKEINEYRIYFIYGPYVVFGLLLLFMIAIGKFKGGMRCASISMIISSVLFIAVVEVGRLILGVSLLNSFNEGSLKITSSMFSSILSFTLFRFYLVPLIFIGLAIVFLVIFRKKKQEPAIIEPANIVNQAQL